MIERRRIFTGYDAWANARLYAAAAKLSDAKDRAAVFQSAHERPNHRLVAD